MKKINEAIIVSVDFNNGADVGILLVGRQKNGKVDIINAFRDKEAVELYKKLTTLRKSPSVQEEVKPCTAFELLHALRALKEDSRMVEHAVVLDDGHENSHCYTHVPASIVDRYDIETFCAMQEDGFSIRLETEEPGV